MRDVEVNGARLRVIERGHGAPVVLVHGAVADYRAWETVLDSFAREHRVIAYSLRHHHPARPDGALPDYGTPRHAEDLLALLRRLALGPAHLVGHSYGGRVAAVAALREPARVRSLVLAEPSLFGALPAGAESEAALGAYRRLAEGLLQILQRDGPEPATRRFLEAMAAPRPFEEFPDRLRDIVLANSHTLEALLRSRAAEAPVGPEELRGLRLPTLLIEGELSPRLFRLATEGLAALWLHADHVVLRGVAHGLHLEAPRFFSDAVRRFLRKVP